MLLLSPQRTACPWQHSSPGTVKGGHDTGGCQDVNSILCPHTHQLILTAILWQFFFHYSYPKISAIEKRQHNLLMYFSCYMYRIKSYKEAWDKMTLWHWPLLAKTLNCICKGQQWLCMFLFLSSFSSYGGAALSGILMLIWKTSHG